MPWHRQKPGRKRPKKGAEGKKEGAGEGEGIAFHVRERVKHVREILARPADTAHRDTDLYDGKWSARLSHARPLKCNGLPRLPHPLTPSSSYYLFPSEGTSHALPPGYAVLARHTPGLTRRRLFGICRRFRRPSKLVALISETLVVAMCHMKISP